VYECELVWGKAGLGGSCPFLGRPRFRLGAACCSVSMMSLLLSGSVALLVGL
jgi:hypothetical protein